MVVEVQADCNITAINASVSDMHKFIMVRMLVPVAVKVDSLISHMQLFSQIHEVTLQQYHRITIVNTLSLAQTSRAHSKYGKMCALPLRRF